jgi:hypothetical protein
VVLDDIEEARALMREEEGAWIDYTAVTPDVIRYEDLFDRGLTERVINIIDGNPGVRDLMKDKCEQFHIEDGELKLSRVYDLLEECEEYLVGASLRKLCLNTIRGYLLDLIYS